MQGANKYCLLRYFDVWSKCKIKYTIWIVVAKKFFKLREFVGGGQSDALQEFYSVGRQRDALQDFYSVVSEAWKMSPDKGKEAMEVDVGYKFSALRSVSV